MQMRIGRTTLSFVRKAPQIPGLYFWKHPAGHRLMSMRVVWRDGGSKDMLIVEGNTSADVTKHDGWFCGPFPSDCLTDDLTITPSSGDPDSPARTLKAVMTDIYQLTDELRYLLHTVNDEAAKAGLKSIEEMGTCDTIRLAQLIIAAERIKP